MTLSAVSVRRFEISRVVRGAFGTVRRNLATFVVLALVLSVAPRVLAGLLGEARSPQGVEWLGLVLGALVLACLLQAAIIHGAASDLQGRKASLQACVTTAAVRLVPLTALWCVAIAAQVLAGLFLVIPALVLAVLWTAAAPALVVERRGVWASLKRSGELTRGRRWAVLGTFVVFLVFGVIGWFVAIFATALAGVISPASAEFALKQVLAPVSGAAYAVISATATAAIYHELKVTREGAGAEALAAAFD